MSIIGKARILIGRCEPPHRGHFHLVSESLKKAEYVILLLGSSGRPRTIKNPFTFEERRDIFMQWARAEGFVDRLCILPLRDFHYNNNHWIHQVQQKVQQAKFMIEATSGGTLNEIVLTGSDRDTSTWYLHAFPQWRTEFEDPFSLPGVPNVNATSIRQVLFNDGDINLASLHEITFNFLKKFRSTEAFQRLLSEHFFMLDYLKPYSLLKHPPTFQTVDAVIVQSGHTLMVKRANLPGFGLWALPGGHLKPNQWIREAIVCETTEETGLRLAKGHKSLEITHEILQRSMRELKTFDHPERSLRKRSITTAGYIRLDDTKPLPHVTGQNVPLDESGGLIIPETSKAAWIPNIMLPSMMNQIFEDHLDIIEDFQGITYGVI